MANAAQQGPQNSNAPNVPSAPSTPEPAKAEAQGENVRIRVKTGRLLIERGAGEDKYAEVGEVLTVPRKWADKLLGREFEGYPVPGGGNGVGKMPGVIRDTTIELVT